MASLNHSFHSLSQKHSKCNISPKSLYHGSPKPPFSLQVFPSLSQTHSKCNISPKSVYHDSPKPLFSCSSAGTAFLEQNKEKKKKEKTKNKNKPSNNNNNHHKNPPSVTSRLNWSTTTSLNYCFYASMQVLPSLSKKHTECNMSPKSVYHDSPKQSFGPFLAPEVLEQMFIQI